MEYRVVLSDAEDKALRHVTYDPQEWIQYTISERCRLAIEDIVQNEIERITSFGGSISGTKEDIVMDAPIKSGKEIEEENMKGIQANVLKFAAEIQQ